MENQNIEPVMDQTIVGEYNSKDDFIGQLTSTGAIDMSAFIYLPEKDKITIAEQEADKKLALMNDDDVIEATSYSTTLSELREKMDRKDKIVDEMEDLDDEISELSGSIEDLTQKLAKATAEEIDGLKTEIAEYESQQNEKKSELENLREEYEELKQIDYEQEKSQLARVARSDYFSEESDRIVEKLANPVDYFVNETKNFTVEDLLLQPFVRIDEAKLDSFLEEKYDMKDIDGKFTVENKFAEGGKTNGNERIKSGDLYKHNYFGVVLVTKIEDGDVSFQKIADWGNINLFEDVMNHKPVSVLDTNGHEFTITLDDAGAISGLRFMQNDRKIGNPIMTKQGIKNYLEELEEGYENMQGYDAFGYASKLFLTKEQMKEIFDNPDVHILTISSEDPLSKQLKKITGDSWNANDFEGSTSFGEIITHKKTKQKFTVLNQRESLFVDHYREKYLGEKFAEGGISDEIIGHTRSGKAIYADADNEHHKDFTWQDYDDALDAGDKKMDEAIHNKDNAMVTFYFKLKNKFAKKRFEFARVDIDKEYGDNKEFAKGGSTEEDVIQQTIGLIEIGKLNYDDAIKNLEIDKQGWEDLARFNEKIIKKGNLSAFGKKEAEKKVQEYRDMVPKTQAFIDAVKKHFSKNEFAKGGKTKSGKQYPEKGSPEWHKIKIAKQTLQMTDAGAAVMGGPTKEEAKKTLDEYGIKYCEGGTAYEKGGKTQPEFVNNFDRFAYPHFKRFFKDKNIEVSKDLTLRDKNNNHVYRPSMQWRKEKAGVSVVVFYYHGQDKTSVGFIDYRPESKKFIIELDEPDIKGELKTQDDQFAKGGTIETDTSLLPWLIAEIVAEHKLDEHTKLPLNEERAKKSQELQKFLVDRAETLYKKSEHFKKSVNAKGNKGRDNLYMWFGHWSDAYLKDPKYFDKEKKLVEQQKEFKKRERSKKKKRTSVLDTLKKMND